MAFAFPLGPLRLPSDGTTFTSMADMTTIYVQLLEEGTTVYRPTQGVAMGGQVFLLLATPDYERSEEVWEFLPGSLVVCENEVKQREAILIARRLADVERLP